MSLFYHDHQTNTHASWDDLIYELNQTSIFSNICKDTNTYNVFKCLILSLIVDKPITLLDSDFTENEVSELLGRTNNEKHEFLNKPLIKNKKELLSIINQNDHKEWELTLFTSGTTGIPKKVKHPFSTITRNVKISDKHNDDIWGFAYNPTHMAGVQVFLQALANGNSIINLFNSTPSQIFKLIEEFQITHLSATPSFLNQLTTSEKKHPSVKSITSGGERFNPALMQNLSSIFVNARFKNIYALTEAGSLFTANGDLFVIAETDKVKIVNSILYIHQSLLGNFDFTDEWYETGDIVEVVSNNPLTIKFISREKEIINVGGYKVNPHEVEHAIKSIKGVTEVVVYAKSNSVLGNIVVADVVQDGSLTESDIRLQLISYLQEFKIPRVIRFVENIELSRTGKTKRIQK